MLNVHEYQISVFSFVFSFWIRIENYEEKQFQTIDKGIGIID